MKHTLAARILQKLILDFDNRVNEEKKNHVGGLFWHYIVDTLSL